MPKPHNENVILYYTLFMLSTIEYYNQNANSFSKSTVSVDFSETQQRFLKYLPPKAKILDFGCGAGRDTKSFLEKGFFVDAIDGSEELCKIASAYTGIHVKHMFFQDLNSIEEYDGIWACASLLHLPWDKISSVLKKMSRALKTDGTIYASFKYGSFTGERNGRFFTDLNENQFEELLVCIPELKQKESWVSSDVRPGKENEKWLNVILSK
ncbi:MAG: class I SAM-dependent methyltransferase [Fibrobacter sp.]|nr:class I SAM-dependent methyltransferase [Fibrobacter sp.]